MHGESVGRVEVFEGKKKPLEELLGELQRDPC